MYSEKKRVAYSEVSGSGCADIAQVAEFFQDISCAHSEHVGGGIKTLLEEEGCGWLLAGWQIIVDRYPAYHEEITVQTIPYAFDSIVAFRGYQILDSSGACIASANANWFLIDVKKGMPRRISSQIASAYDPLDPKPDLQYASRKVRYRGDMQRQEPILVRRAFTDTNHHMNNSWYIRLAMECLPADFVIRQVRVEYTRAAVSGDRIFPYTAHDENVWHIRLADEAGQTYAMLEFTRALAAEPEGTGED